MADFDKIVRKHMNDEGMIPADSVPALVQDISKCVGDNFVTVDRYNTKKALADELQTKLENAGDLQKKYDTLKGEYDSYKSEQEKKETNAKKRAAYSEDVLKSLNIPEKRFAAILKTVNLDGLSLTAEGKLENVEDLKKAAKEDWGDFIVTTQKTGVQSANPPANNGAKTSMTKDEIMAIKDTTARQKAMLDNRELFGI